MNVDQITQTAIALLGASAVWLSQSRTNRFQKWACIVGLLQQPFWFWLRGEVVNGECFWLASCVR